METTACGRQMAQHGAVGTVQETIQDLAFDQRSQRGYRLGPVEQAEEAGIVGRCALDLHRIATLGGRPDQLPELGGHGRGKRAG